LEFPMRILVALAALLLATVSIAAASSGLKWSASESYEDGSPIESAQKIVYLVYDAAGKQVGSRFETSIAGSALPADGCYRVKAALYSADTNGIIPASESLTFSPSGCTKALPPPPPVQKRVAAPASVVAQ
jgi:hypothetical protein